MHFAKLTLAAPALTLFALPAQAEPTLDRPESLEYACESASFEFGENAVLFDASIYAGQDQSSWLNPLSTIPAVVLYSNGQFVGTCAVEEGQPLCPDNPTNIVCPFPEGAQRYPMECSADLDLVADPPELGIDIRESADAGLTKYARIDAALTPNDGNSRTFLRPEEAASARPLARKALSDYLANVDRRVWDLQAVAATCEWDVGTLPGSAPDDCEVRCVQNDTWRLRMELWERD